MNRKHRYYGIYEAWIKRPIDFVFAGTALIILSPVMAVLAVLIYVKLGLPILFIQERPGKNGKIFKLYKFRSMSSAKNGNGNLLPDKDRLTPFGRWLRSTSLDELPEFINVLKGDMSVIGPRPLTIQYLPFYTEKEKHRHDVRPGLSGLAQIHGRNALSWEKRFQYDLQYVNKITFAGDVWIAWKTIEKVLSKENIQVAGEGELLDFDVYRKKQREEKRKTKIIDFSSLNLEVYKEPILLLFCQEYKAIHKEEEGNWGAKRYEDLCKYIEMGNAVCQFLFYSEILCGFIWFFKQDQSRIHINEFVVEENWRGKGFGRRLIHEVYQYAKDHGCRKVELFVAENNEEAKRFYQKQGFAIGERNPHLKRIQMVKTV